MFLSRWKDTFAWRPALSLLIILSFKDVVRADNVLYQYECDTLPYSPGTGWEIANTCVAPQCTESLADGYFILDWPPNMGDIVNYDHTITPSGTSPPPTLWIEWRFRSTLPMPPTSPGCDGRMSIVYDRIGEVVYLHGTGAVSFEGGQFITGLALNEFHTLRFESIDGLNYHVAVNGQVFIADVGGGTGGTRSRLQFSGEGGCPRHPSLGMHNDWDMIRYGTIGDGEAIVATDPPSGVLDSAKYPNLDRFTVTFDQPNYVYIDDVAVDVQGNEATGHEGSQGAFARSNPVVIATKRLDNGPPETVEIVLDRPLAIGTTTRFTLNTGGTPNTVEYTLLESQPCCFPSGLCTEVIDCISEGGSLPSIPCEGDTDLDGLDAACGDACPSDPVKIAPGQCGCGVPDTDSDSDTIPDCVDQCEDDDDRIDANANGTPDCLESTDIPAASAWSLVILALLLSIAAKIAYSSRSRGGWPIFGLIEGGAMILAFRPWSTTDSTIV